MEKRKTNAIQTLLIGLIPLVTFILGGCTTKIEEPIRSRIVDIKNSFGVNVNYIYDRELFFPDSWLQPPISAEGSQIALEEVAGILPLIEEFLQKYPLNVVQRNLSDIYLLGDLQVFGKPCGYTTCISSFYIASKGVSGGYTDLWLLGVMHSEFACILFRNYKNLFPTEAWKDVNECDWQYGGNEVEMLGENDLFGQYEGLLSQGFLCRYSQGSLESDFKMFSFWLFSEPDRLIEPVTKYDRINKKYRLVIKFYKNIDPKFCIP